MGKSDVESKRKTPKHRWVRLANLALLTISIVWLFIVTKPILPPRPLPILLLPYFLVLLWLVLYAFGIIAILTHELGHLVGGLCVGFVLYQLKAGPIKIEKQRHGYRHSLGETRDFRGGGIIRMLPVADHNLTNRFLVITATGPLATLVLGGITAIAAILTYDPSGWIRFLISILSAVSFIGFVACIIPYDTKDGAWTDGKTLMTLLMDESLQIRIMGRSTACRAPTGHYASSI
jgi:hypothetical protein